MIEYSEVSIRLMWMPRPGSSISSRLEERSREVMANLASFSGCSGAIKSLGSLGGYKMNSMLVRKYFCPGELSTLQFGTSSGPLANASELLAKHLAEDNLNSLG